MNLSVDAIPALRDNYIWAFHDGRDCVLVDPGEAHGPIGFLRQNRLRLAGLILTHHHADHIGGADEILDLHPAPAWGPDDDRMPERAERVREGDRVEISRLALEFAVIDTPGHTTSHIAFAAPGILLAGDTLFSVGCGRLFEGTPAQMQETLDKLAGLPAETMLYCGHEYTVDNCRFALAVEPGNRALIARAEQAQKLRAAGKNTLPSRLGEEKQVNPFLRTREPEVIAAAAAREDLPDTRPETVFGVIRCWKDRF